MRFILFGGRPKSVHGKSSGRLRRYRPQLEALEDRVAPALDGLFLAAGDLNNDGRLDIVTGAGLNGGPHVRSYDVAPNSDLQLRQSFFAYGASFTGGVRVAVGDVTGNGRDEIVTAAGFGGGPHIKVFDGVSGQLLRSFFAYAPSFTGGVYVAVGDVNNDGYADIITAAGEGGGPHVKVFDGRTNQLIRSFFAYAPHFTGGVRVAAGDINNDGFADIIVAPGPGGGPHVQVFDGRTNQIIRSFFAYAPHFTGGVHVASGDINNDGFADLITSPGFGGGPHVRVFSGATNQVLRDFFAYAPNYAGGVHVASGDFNNDGFADLITTRASGSFNQYPGFFSGQTGQKIQPPRLFLETAGYVNLNGGVVYFPSGLGVGIRYPVAFAFAPNGDPHFTLNYLVQHAEQRKFIVFASSYYRNGPPVDDNVTLGHINNALQVLPADGTRVILTGFSGGGSYAHHLNIRYPGIASVLIINTAMIWGTQIPDTGTPNGPYDYEYADANKFFLAQQYAQSTSRRLIVFLASPGDFRYEEMQRDRALYPQLGWKPYYTEFAGGHTLAPAHKYVEALNWVFSQPEWLA
ncbi:MAG: FG-GAP-like repeat-containing protein [Gemmataceae bacterium]